MNNNLLNEIASHPLQTSEWGEFRRLWGNKVVELAFGQLTLHPIPFLPYSLAAFEKGPAPTQKMIDELKSLARQERLIFIKLEPNCLKDEKLVSLLKRNGAVYGKTLFTPTTFWIDLTPSEEDLLKSFHPKTRYNIRLAQKNGVEIKEDNSEKAFNKYLSLMRDTVHRQRFYAHSEKYHRLMWQVLHEDMVRQEKSPIARLLTATYQGEVITTWIVFVWKDFLYYPYGASTELHKNVMANNLMMWEAIRYGKSLGLKTFDLWGREEGKGFTKFKEGYNPKVVEFLGTWDLITSPFYWPYRLAEALRWLILKTKSKFTNPIF